MKTNVQDCLSRNACFEDFVNPNLEGWNGYKRDNKLLRFLSEDPPGNSRTELQSGGRCLLGVVRVQKES